MELNLLPILNFEGKKLQISEDVELSENSGDGFSINAPVKFEGVAVNVGGTVELCGNASAVIDVVCDRCVESFEKTIEFPVDEKLKKEDEFSDSEQNPDIIKFKGTTIDLSDIIYSNLYMNIPTKNLCSDDCKGLCPMCGTNLNHGSCSCDDDVTDPRFDILDKLL